MLKHPNYTFSIPNKWLYTLFKGITVTPRFVRASSVSSHERAPLHVAPLVSPSYGALYTSNTLTCRGTFQTEPRPLFAPHLRCRHGPRCQHDQVGSLRHPA
jgi:hypothetical protein